MNKNEIRRLKKGKDLIEVLLNDIKTSGKLSAVFNRRDSFHHIFYNENRFDEVFLSIFPIERLEIISSVLHTIKTAISSSGNLISGYNRIEIKKDELISILEEIKLYIVRSMEVNGFNIFYSWQSDLQNNTNRTFIESALEQSIRDISKELQIPFSLDKDTTNRSGSPDIAKTILEKINSCFIFVADISIVLASDKKGKKTPNPNVLFELGYAQGVLGEENIIMVFNTAFGTIEELPFDLRGKRIMQYSCHSEMSDTEKAAAKSELKKQLSRAIRLRGNSEIR
ncbi:TIR domain-containing protein [Paenibacillus sp. FSL R7-0652]|uniref:TIR domain-containing protein n=1 Tax=Paenibacillus sp. FSL R7-0652 TaxID=2921687 RepID=UPI00315A3FE1